uniref:NADH-ubiquinone oxidoreductase chain 6 n=1 Tax=Eucriotettix oculatus TaxID=470944 RepID=A0A7T0II59_9ORTH|nr:NADH dehydrogenase subunit 6 [Eucriotettix oculatus]
MSIIMLMSTTLNIMFMNTKQPMMMVIIILMQTTTSTFMMNTLNKSPWFNYILMIIFIGGMMVLFIYITSISPNEKNFNYIKLLPIITMIMLMIMMKKTPNNESSETTINQFNMTNYEQMNMNMMFNYPLYSMSIMMMLYLFIALIVINKISNIEQGPLRMKIN